MKSPIAFVIIGLTAFCSYAQKTPMTFNLLGQDDRIVLDSLDSSRLYHSIKFVPLTNGSYFSFGGSYRIQMESFINEEFRTSGKQDNVWYLSRLLLHAHYIQGNQFEVYAELNNSLVFGKDLSSPVDQDELAINQFFIGFSILPDLRVEIGRKNLRLGSGRLVDVREGPNVRRGFDLFQLRYTTERFNALALFGSPVVPGPKVFDNSFMGFEETLTAIYSTIKLDRNQKVDFYTFYQKDDDVAYSNASGDERRVSLGVRHFGTLGKWFFNNEFVYQFGTLDTYRIRAWTISFQLENTLLSMNPILRSGLKAEIISGDRSKEDETLNTFDALYPRGAYFGRVARFGPSNLIDIHPYLNMEFGKWFFETDLDIFWRHSTDDGIYNAALVLEYPDTNDERFIASQWGGIIGFRLNDHLSFELEGNMISPGTFLKEQGQVDSLYHLVFTTEFKF